MSTEMPNPAETTAPVTPTEPTPLPPIRQEAGSIRCANCNYNDPDRQATCPRCTKARDVSAPAEA